MGTETSTPVSSTKPDSARAKADASTREEEGEKKRAAAGPTPEAGMATSHTARASVSTPQEEEEPSAMTTVMKMLPPPPPPRLASGAPQW